MGTRKASGQIRVGGPQGLTLTAEGSAAAGSLLLWLGLAVAARLYGRLSPGAAAGVGAVAVLLHWLSDTAHQLGHARAARGAGYPMTGIRYHTILAGSVYPSDEPDLPAEIHVRRALGGAPVGLALGALTALLTIPVRRRRTAAGFLAWQFSVENILVLGLGAFLPLGFTDGSTLLKWVPRLRKR